MSHLNRPIKGYKQYTTTVDSFDGGAFSLDFTSSPGNTLEKITPVDLNFADEYSVMAWVKGAVGLNTGTIWRATGSGGADFQRLEHIGFGASFRMSMRDTSFRTRTYDWDASGTNVWTQAVAVHNSAGNTIDVYTDGAAGTTKTEQINDATSLTNPTRTPIVGNVSPAHTQSYTGRIYQVAVWNSKLTLAEITAIYNGGNGRFFDLSVDSGNYVSSANLQHWWGTGRQVVPNLGKDYGNGTAVDLTDVTDLDDTDRVMDAPE
jgi:hypothetical protein